MLPCQAHFDRCPLPISDYVTDTRSVLDQAVRVMNAMLDIAAGFGLLETTLGLLRLHQMVVQVGACSRLRSRLCVYVCVWVMLGGVKMNFRVLAGGVVGWVCALSRSEWSGWNEVQGRPSAWEG